MPIRKRGAPYKAVIPKTAKNRKLSPGSGPISDACSSKSVFHTATHRCHDFQDALIRMALRRQKRRSEIGRVSGANRLGPTASLNGPSEQKIAPTQKHVVESQRL